MFLWKRNGYDRWPEKGRTYHDGVVRKPLAHIPQELDKVLRVAIGHV